MIPNTMAPRRLVLLTAACGLGLLCRCSDDNDTLPTDASPDVLDASAVDGALPPDAIQPDAIQPDTLQSDTAPSVVPQTWVTIAKGSFTMGSPTSEPCRTTGMGQETLHKVTLTRSFEMQSTEVTQGQFASLMGYNPSHFGPGGRAPTAGPLPGGVAHLARGRGLLQRAVPAGRRRRLLHLLGRRQQGLCQEAAAYDGQQDLRLPGLSAPHRGRVGVCLSRRQRRRPTTAGAATPRSARPVWARTQTPPPSPGTAPTRAAGRTPWGRSRRTAGASTTWRAMSMSGVTTSTSPIWDPSR